MLVLYSSENPQNPLDHLGAHWKSPSKEEEKSPAAKQRGVKGETG